MKNFSNIENNLVTTKESLIESFSAESGLPKNVVTRLYEDAYQQYGDDTSVEGKFKSLLKVGLTTFTDSMSNLISILKDSSKDVMNGMIIKLLDATAENNTIAFFKIIMYLLFMKDSANFARIAKDMNIDEKIAGFLETKTTNLFESIGIGLELGDKPGEVPRILGLNDGCEVQEDIQFYTDLKTILARNNKRWGHNYHLDSVYAAICNYLDCEIEYLVNKDNITTVDNNYEDTLIRQLITGELNVMYRDINVLRPLIADIQTLNFDLMCLIMNFIKQNSHLCKYISRKSFDEFLEAFNALYGKLSSSRKTSLVLVPYEEPDTSNGSSHTVCKTSKSLEILENVYVDTDKYDLYLQPLKIQSVVDMIYIMKSCSFDFNLMIRPYMRNFITKAFEVVGKLDHVIAESVKINKYKNPMY